MKIGVDLHVLQGINQGSKTYLEGIYSSDLIRNQTDIDFKYYFDGRVDVPSAWADRSFRSIPGFGNKYYRLTLCAPFLRRTDNFDYFHSQYISPLFLGRRNIVTVHDILFEEYPEFFTPSFVARSRILVKFSAKKAALVLTVSEYSKRKLVETYGLKEQDVAVVPNGVRAQDYNFSKSDAINYIQAKYNLENYILTVGRLEPRKNHALLIRAYSTLRKKSIELPKLVIVGQPDFSYKGLFDLVRELNLGDYVKFVSDANYYDILRFYKAAMLFVYPSFAEGFGIPPLEAMAAGCPVITSGSTAMSELYAGGGVLIDPHSDDDLVNAISNFLNIGFNKELGVYAESLVRRYSWDASADAILKAYRTLP